MRDLLLRVTGMHKYVQSIQMLNEHLSAENLRYVNRINELMHALDEQKANNKKLFQYNNELQEENKALNECNVQLADDCNKLNDNCNQYNAQCAKFTSQLQSLRGTIGSLKRKLTKYEQA